jgi:redox-sensitive bicupin YhaK (pirin superfamily)
VDVSVVVRRGLNRFLTREKGRRTAYSFSFGEFYDPDRLSFGPLVALNDELLGTGSGYDAHAHSEVVLVTWVVSGALTHADGSGTTVQQAGELAVTEAGSGITHSERAEHGATRFVQMWLRPGEPGARPTRRTAAPDLSGGTFVAVAGLQGLPLGVPGATLWLADVAAGTSVELPVAPLVYVFVVSGALTRNSLAEPLAAGDTFEIREPTPAIDGREPYAVTTGVPTQLLVWTFDG